MPAGWGWPQAPGRLAGCQNRRYQNASEQKMSECSDQNGCGGVAAPATALAQGRQAVQRTLEGGQGSRPGTGAPVSLQQQERGGQAPCDMCWTGSQAHHEPLSHLPGRVSDAWPDSCRLDMWSHAKA